MRQGQPQYPTYPTAQRGRATSAVDSRARFIARTYNHLFLAIVAFTAIEIGLFMSGMAETIFAALTGVSWLIVLGGFVITGWLASSWAHRSHSLPMQYLGLGVYVVAEAIIFVPMLYYIVQGLSEKKAGKTEGTEPSSELTD